MKSIENKYVIVRLLRMFYSLRHVRKRFIVSIVHEMYLELKTKKNVALNFSHALLLFIWTKTTKRKLSNLQMSVSLYMNCSVFCLFHNGKVITFFLNAGPETEKKRNEKLTWWFKNSAFITKISNDRKLTFSKCIVLVPQKT